MRHHILIEDTKIKHSNNYVTAFPVPLRNLVKSNETLYLALCIFMEYIKYVLTKKKKIIYGDGQGSNKWLTSFVMKTNVDVTFNKLFLSIRGG